MALTRGFIVSMWLRYPVMTSTQETCRARMASASVSASIITMLDGRATDEGPANDGAVTSALLDRCCAGLANHFVLRPCAARAADRPDDFSCFDERDSAARGNHAIEREGVV